MKDNGYWYWRKRSRFQDSLEKVYGTWISSLFAFNSGKAPLCGMFGAGLQRVNMMYRVLELGWKLQERRGRGGKPHRVWVSVSSDDPANGKRSESRPAVGIAKATGWILRGSCSNAGLEELYINIDFQSFKIISCGSYLESSIDSARAPETRGSRRQQQWQECQQGPFTEDSLGTWCSQKNVSQVSPSSLPNWEN